MILGILIVCFHSLCLVALSQAGFYTFYFPNALKKRGIAELSDMVDKVENQINEARDQFSDARYFWGLMQNLDKQVQAAYPEESACSEVFPLFRDLAIEYAYIDYDHYVKPFEEYRKKLVEFKAKWYPSGAESTAQLPRSWENELLRFELESKIKWFDSLANNADLRYKRQRMIDIWRKVRRSLDHSLPCIYLRYAYRQVADDINQMAIDANLDGLLQAKKVLLEAYKRVAMFKSSDMKIVDKIVQQIDMEGKMWIAE